MLYSRTTGIRRSLNVAATTVTAALFLGLSSSAAHAAGTVITFDDLPGYPNVSGGAFIPDGYYGLNWQQSLGSFGVINSAAYPLVPSGYKNGTVSGTNVLYSLGGTISSPTGFELDSGYFTAAWYNGLSVTATGTQVGGTTVFTKTFTVNVAGPALETFDWSNLSTLNFTTSGGIQAQGYPGSGAFFALDNLTINGTSSVPSTPEPGVLVTGFSMCGMTALGLVRGRLRRRQPATTVLISEPTASSTQPAARPAHKRCRAVSFRGRRRQRPGNGKQNRRVNPKPHTLLASSKALPEQPMTQSATARTIWCVPRRNSNAEQSDL